MRKWVASTVCAAVLLGGCSGGGVSLRLNVKPGEKLTYEVTRSIRTTPQDAGNGDKEVSLKCTIEPDGGTSTQIKYTILEFHGNDPHDQLTTNHMSRIASVIKGTKLVGMFDKRLQGTVTFGSENPGGWAGFVGLVAMGMFRPGLIGPIYPDGPVNVGDEWSADFDAAFEHSRVPQYERVTNSTYSLKYKLDSITGDGENCTAVITYQFVSDVSAEQTILDRTTRFSIKTNESGTIDVNTGSGLPIRAAIRSIVQSLDGAGNVKDIEVNRFQVKLVEPTSTSAA